MTTADPRIKCPSIAYERCLMDSLQGLQRIDVKVDDLSIKRTMTFRMVYKPTSYAI